MARHRSGLPEVFSTAFLDMIFCALAGIIVLYVISEPPLDFPRKEMPERQLTIRVPTELGQPRLRVVVVAGAGSIEASLPDEPGPWLVSKEPYSATLLVPAELKYPIRVTIWVEDFDINSAPLTTAADGTRPVRISIDLLDLRRSGAAVIDEPTAITLDDDSYYASKLFP